MAPRRPPSALQMIEAVPISKKQVTTSGMTTVGKIPMLEVMRIVAVEETSAVRKPIRSALGAYGNTTGQSRAGMAPGTILSAMPWKAGMISAMSRRMPWNRTVVPTPK